MLVKLRIKEVLFGYSIKFKDFVDKPDERSIVRVRLMGIERGLKGMERE